jgi:superfamily II helicase
MTSKEELFSAFVQHMNQMAQKLQIVQELQRMVDTENTYEGKMKIYDTMKLRMDEFDKLKIMTLDLHTQLQTILDAKQLMEIDELMKRINMM